MNKEQDFSAISKSVKKTIIELSGGNGCFIGSGFSVQDILIALYFNVMKIDQDRMDDPDRDYLILSKGHASCALYAVLLEKGLMTRDKLKTHGMIGSDIYLHPNLSVNGVEVATGSLGHGLPVGAGIAKGIKLDKGANRVFVVVGDGELQEGSIWESAMTAASHKLDNLCVIVDRNRIQANMRTEELIPLESLADKWKAFGWNVVEIDGHDHAQITMACKGIPVKRGMPTTIIANTKRGKDVSFLEDRIDKWFARLGADEIRAALREIEK